MGTDGADTDRETPRTGVPIPTITALGDRVALAGSGPMTGPTPSGRIPAGTEAGTGSHRSSRSKTQPLVSQSREWQ